MIQIKIDENNSKKRLDVFLVEHFENKYPRAKLTNAIEKKYFLVNQNIQKASYKLKLNDIISFNEIELDNFLNPDLTLKPWGFKLIFYMKMMI